MPDEIKLSEISKKIVVGGTYEHYKGMVCKVLGVALHSETLEEMVVYQHVDKEKMIWVRPLEMFLENVEIDGVTKARFKYVNNN
ncbi:MAG: DUF1653 domain-containing protein [Candidatus Shapirobacteria bacterium]